MADHNDPFMRNRDAAVQARTKAQNRANVLQMKLIGQSHPTGLTSNLLKLFEPRPPLVYLPPPEKRKCPGYTGMAQFVKDFAEPSDPEYALPIQKGETPGERKARIHMLRLEKGALNATEELQKYDPNNDPNISGDPYKTLFVARLNYETSEHRIKREFETYGPIKRVRLITDKETNKPRGYAFIEYAHTRDMKTAYKQADGRKLDNRRVLVDVERGRTVPNWRPRRLGGGLGSTRVGGEEVNQKHSGREPQQMSSGPPRSEEPRVRDDQEKSRERGRERDREREKSRERSHDKTRERDTRDDRHHKERDRTREKDRERDRGRDRDRDRGRDRDRERDHGRDYDRERRDRPRERERDRDRDYGRASHERDRGYSHERGGADYEQFDTKHDRDRAGVKERDLEHGEHDYGQEWFDPATKNGKNEHEQGYDHFDQLPPEDDANRMKRHEYYANDKYDKMQTDYYRSQYEQPDSAPEEGERVEDHDYEYHRSERSLSREYEH